MRFTDFTGGLLAAATCPALVRNSPEDFPLTCATLMRVIFLLNFLAVFPFGSALAQASPKPELGSAQSFHLRPARTGIALDTTGWRFITRPVVDAVDDNSGEVRFKIVIDSEGVIESVLPVSSTVSARQEALCRQVLLRCRFEHIGTKPGGAVGYYTFKFMVR
ncbi:hypothetical protein [Hymenobacter siberiensis]|nr:hypothetical protein [Hymenobacter siberiensis]